MRIEATHRVQLVFSLLDADGNGVLEARDFDLMAGRVVAAAPDSDEAAHGAMRDAFLRYWTTLAAELDADGDGRITFEEYTACVLSPERFDATVDAFARALAALGDPAGEGQVSRPAFVALMTAIGFGRANIDALFDAFGPTPEDRIAVATWVEGIKAYYAPDKAGIPGDHLVDTAAV
ncbi:EF-hand domain-containing protein [Streptomyces sp. KE1]|uniref:EF-hand domain-containing protein n=1 Tax=Streptomyces sp. KE1 TaxID=1638939 RepID=UPI00063E80C5|nr:EF-hand domain-containing protein [Streptomyces sp. KE1]KLJ03493.1 calcium-binding protein [Streptomyces sp. KE1]